MDITIEIKTVNTDKDSAFRASANIVLGGVFIIRNAKLIHTNKTFMAMPSQRGRRGFWFNCCHPITNDFRLEMEETFIAAYQSHLAENDLTNPDTEE